MAGRSGESPDGPGRGEPDLAPPLRRGPGTHGGRLRPARGAAVAPGTARLPGGAVRGRGLVVQADDSRNRVEPHVSARRGTPRGSLPRRPGKSPAVADESPPPGRGSPARQPPGDQRAARP